MQDYKNNKVLELKKEMVKVPNQTDYEINGIDTSRALFFYRKEKEKFKVIPRGSYTIVDVASNKYLRITDSNLLSEAIEFQVCYLFIKSSSSYVDPFPELERLQEHYNELYSDFDNLLQQLQSNNIVGDTMKMSYVLPQLDEGQVWVLRQGQMKAEAIFDLDARLQEAFENFTRVFDNWIQTEKKPEITRFVDSEKDRVLQAINQKETQSIENIDSHTTNKIAEIEAEGLAQKNLVTGEGNKQVERVKTQGDTEVERVRQTGLDGKVSKTGDTMTGDLTLPNLTANGNIFANGTVRSTSGVYDSGSRVYSPVNKPSPEEISMIGSRYGYLPTFDGTWGDFRNKVPAGTFTIEPTRHSLLKLSGYGYGTLTVEYASAGPYKNQCVITYVGDNARDIQIFSNWNFSAQSTETFDNVWKSISDSSYTHHIMNGAMRISYKREGLVGKIWFTLGNVNDSTGVSFRLDWNSAICNIGTLFGRYEVAPEFQNTPRFVGVARGWKPDAGYFWSTWVVNINPNGGITSGDPTAYTCYSRTTGYLEVPLVRL